MSTRCHIIISDSEYGDTILYRHSDGYPEGDNGVLATLVPFMQEFMQHRGWDPCYLPAQLVAHLIVKDKEYLRDFYRRKIAEHTSPEDQAYRGRLREYLAEVDHNYLGYGISQEMHGDTEYVYVVTRDAIHVYNGDRTKALTTTPQGKAMMSKGTIPKKWRPEPTLT